jgi:serine/threonine protein kinase/Tfp pilus assembly protein PilF
MPLPSGTSLGRYEIRSPIGKGGMGEVYLAYDSSLRRQVAVKILPAEFTQNKLRLSRFEREAYAASSLNHPNILTIYEIGQQEGHHFIATEYIEGESLRGHMKGKRMKMSDVLNVAIQTADALSAAHEAGIVHRDIKPENIMLRKRDGYVKVLDFGLAKLTEQQPVIVDTEAPTKALFKTTEGVVMGTLIYMSPEQARGVEVDTRTDIWSLGVVLYETIAGCLPFEGSTTSEVLASILNEKEQPPLTRFAREVPAELERIIEKALRKDRERRYQTIKDMLLDLKSLKQRLEFEAELERSVSPHVVTTDGSTRGGQRPVETMAQSAPRQTPGAEYLIGEVKRYKRGLMIVSASLMMLATVAYFYFGRTNKTVTASKAIVSIAVLPFVNVNANSDTEYLSDGITDSLINNLSQLTKLKVIARSSVFSYKGREADPQAVGRELNVQGLVTGRITQRGDNLLLSVELTDTRDKSHIWGEQYNRKISDFLAVQEEISSDISEKLRLKLTSEEQKRVTKRYTENPEAYQLYLKGRYFADQFTEGKKAVEHFNQAIKKDPNYALAYAGLAEAYWEASAQTLSPREAMPKAREAAVKALRIDDTLAEAHTALAVVQAFYDYDLPGAEKEFKRAIELNPGSASVHQWYGWYLVALKRADEALKEIKHAQELDPLSLVTNVELGMPFYVTRQYDQAIEQFKKAVEMDPNRTFARFSLGWTYILTGRYEEAIAISSKPGSDDPYLLAATGHAYALLGKRAEAQKMIERLKEQSTQRYVPPDIIAKIYIGLREKEQALDWLEKSYEDREDALIWLNSDPLFDDLRSEPRFRDLVRRVGLAK